MDFEKIKAAAQAYQADMTRFLRDMISHPSESCEEREVVHCIKAEMEKLGYDKVEIDGLGNVIGWMGDGDKIIAIDSHIDTVGVGNIDNWTHDPYQGYEDDQVIYGRGGSDPRVVDNPQVMKTVTYRELRELSYMGATVIHEDAIFPVMQKKIPIRIKNTNSPEDAGTLILADTDEPAENTVTGVAGRKGFSSINIEKYRIHDECGAVRKMLEVLEEHGVNFEHIPSGIDNFSIVVETTSLGDETDDIVYDIKKVTSASSVTVENGIALIAVVGRSMKSTRGVAGTIFSSLAKENINIKMIDQGSSEINIVIAVAERDYERTINTIYSAFVK